MTSQVEGGSELAALQQAAELEASEQKRVAEKAMEDEANSVLKVKREKRERGRRQRKEIMDEFEEDDDEDDEDDDEEENGQATVKATDVEKAWKEILGLVESSQGKIVARNITETYEKYKALAQGGAKQLQVILQKRMLKQVVVYGSSAFQVTRKKSMLGTSTSKYIQKF